MAVIVRRTWAQLRDEAIKRAGNLDATGFSGRVEYTLWAAWHDLTTTYHFTGLDKIDTSLVLSTSTNELALPTDCFIVVGVGLRSAAGTTYLGPMTPVDYRTLFQDYTATSGQPTRRARFGASLWFDKKPDAAYHIDLAYYRFATAPDYSSTSPELSSDVDEHLVEGALRKLFPAIGRPDIGEVNAQLLSEWLGFQVRPALAAASPAAHRLKPLDDTTTGGAQG